MNRFLIAFALLCLGSLPGYAAFLDGLTGAWRGSGSAYLRGVGDINASCRMQGSGSVQSVQMLARCGVLLFRLPLGLRITDEGNGRYSGVYTGSRTGPAQLVGTAKGDTLTMDILWGGIVNGDRKASLVLRRTGPNSFRQTVFDHVNGERRRTSQFSFRRQ
ncbi:MAG: hypothetical protein OXR62_08105 [Ahrensia sp.]|nr:hypothetical protein [Ahrensia sp.]